MSARLEAVTKRGVTVGRVYRIGPRRWRVARLSHTRAWCEPADKATPSARWLYLSLLETINPEEN